MGHAFLNLKKEEEKRKKIHPIMKKNKVIEKRGVLGERKEQKGADYFHLCKERIGESVGREKKKKKVVTPKKGKRTSLPQYATRGGVKSRGGGGTPTKGQNYGEKEEKSLSTEGGVGKKEGGFLRKQEPRRGEGRILEKRKKGDLILEKRKPLARKKSDTIPGGKERKREDLQSSGEKEVKLSCQMEKERGEHQLRGGESPKEVTIVVGEKKKKREGPLLKKGMHI